MISGNIGGGGFYTELMKRIGTIIFPRDVEKTAMPWALTCLRGREEAELKQTGSIT